MKYLVTYLLMIFCILTSCGLLGGSNSDDGPPRTIVFSAQDNDGVFQIYSMREDGSGVKQLTGGEYSSTEPDWSPDGSRIAYSRSTGSTAGEALWVMDADGSNKQPLVTNPRTGNPQLGNRPAWSPDGSKLAFDQCLNCEVGGSNYEIFIADLQTGTIDTLTHHPVDDTHPTWNPNETQIAFTSNRDYYDADTLRWRKDLYRVDADDSDLERLTKVGGVGSISWHPKGNRIVFAATDGLFIYDFQDNNILELNIALENLRPIRWSGNGRYLLLSKTETYPKDGLYIFDTQLYTVEQIPLKPRQILGADWFTSPEDEN